MRERQRNSGSGLGKYLVPVQWESCDWRDPGKAGVDAVALGRVWKNFLSSQGGWGMLNKGFLGLGMAVELSMLR